MYLRYISTFKSQQFRHSCGLCSGGFERLAESSIEACTVPEITGGDTRAQSSVNPVRVYSSRGIVCRRLGTSEQFAVRSVKRTDCHITVFVCAV
jgi:hypothetical protein